MAELTNLESKLAEVLGLAGAARSSSLELAGREDPDAPAG